jgi:hypothetical protein
VSLTIFDKINLAHCAAQRAQSHVNNTARFFGEYDSVLCWHNHRVAFITTHLGPMSYNYT